ncbi:MAG: fdrA domain protein [Caldiserica bacterium]|jgi:hypothetical protein|nr:fdrA domain protein [Caldisericota bacterium]
MLANELFKKELKVINIGLLSFKESLDKEGVKTIQIDWKPPATEDEETLDALKKLLGNK